MQLTAESEPASARHDAWRMLSDGDPEGAAEAVERLRRSGAEPEAALGVLAAAVRLEQAVAELDRTVRAAEDGSAQAGTGPAEHAAAIELLARLLALRGDAAEAAEVWRHGAGSTEPAVAAHVRERLRRGFLDHGEDTGAPWWEEFVEAAVVEDSLPLLVGELFSALSRVHALLAAGTRSEAGGADEGPLRAAAEQALNVPSDYLWGEALHGDVAERLRGGD